MPSGLPITAYEVSYRKVSPACQKFMFLSCSFELQIFLSGAKMIEIVNDPLINNPLLHAYVIIC